MESKKIFDFLLGRLSPEEAKEVINMIQTDPEIAQMAIECEQEIEIARQLAKEELLAQMDVWDDISKTPPDLPNSEEPPSRHQDKMKNFYQWLAVSIFLALLSTAIWYLNREAASQEPPASIATNEGTNGTGGGNVETGGLHEANQAASPEDKTYASAQRSEKIQPLLVPEPIKKYYNPFGLEKNLKGKTVPSSASVDTLQIIIDLIKKNLNKSSDFKPEKRAEILMLLNKCSTCDAATIYQWKGHFYLLIGEYEKAAISFKQWEMLGSYKDEAQWYVFLACFCNGEKPLDLYQVAYSSIKNDPDHSYYEALKVLEADALKENRRLTPDQ